MHLMTFGVSHHDVYYISVFVCVWPYFTASVLFCIIFKAFRSISDLHNNIHFNKMRVKRLWLFCYHTLFIEFFKYCYTNMIGIRFLTNISIKLSKPKNSTSTIKSSCTFTIISLWHKKPNSRLKGYPIYPKDVLLKFKRIRVYSFAIGK